MELTTYQYHRSSLFLIPPEFITRHCGRAKLHVLLSRSLSDHFIVELCASISFDVETQSLQKYNLGRVHRRLDSLASAVLRRPTIVVSVRRIDVWRSTRENRCRSFGGLASTRALAHYFSCDIGRIEAFGN